MSTYYLYFKRLISWKVLRFLSKFLHLLTFEFTDRTLEFQLMLVGILDLQTGVIGILGIHRFARNLGLSISRILDSREIQEGNLQDMQHSKCYVINHFLNMNFSLDDLLQN